MSLDQQERAERDTDRGSGGVTGGGRARRHAIVLQNAHGPDAPARERSERVPQGVGQDDRGDDHAEGPAELERGVEIRRRHEEAEKGSHEEGAQGQLGNTIALIHMAEPVFVACFGGGELSGGRRSRGGRGGVVV
jgi:hypothetical protein